MSNLFKFYVYVFRQGQLRIIEAILFKIIRKTLWLTLREKEKERAGK